VLLLEGTQIFAANLRPALDLVEVERLPEARLAETVADLEHRGKSRRESAWSYSAAFSAA
jgi:hypothetical protein